MAAERFQLAAFRAKLPARMDGRPWRCVPAETGRQNADRRVWRRSVRRARQAAIAALAVLAAAAGGCRFTRNSVLARYPNVEPFNFDIALGPNQYHIEGYLTPSTDFGRAPGLLVLNGGEGDAERCVGMSQGLAAMGIDVACISIPGYGRSSGPSRFVGPQSVAAARRALDLLSARPEVDSDRLAVWGLGRGALAAGLLMDEDARPRALILQSGAYDLVDFWRKAPLTGKLAILHEVWPSKRVLAERSVIENLPRRLDCSVLILHGERDLRAPVAGAEKLADALRARGARVITRYFPHASHDLGRRVEPELRAFLRDNLVNLATEASTTSPLSELP
jgi:dipeptidyl aminopeptidase/acylaminoacyl peptidase